MRPDRVALYSSSDRIFCDAGIRLHWPFGNLQLQSGWADKGTNRMVGWTTEFVSVLSFSSTDGVYMLHLNRPLPPSGILSRLDLTLPDPRFQCLHSLLQVFDKCAKVSLISVPQACYKWLRIDLSCFRCPEVDRYVSAPCYRYDCLCSHCVAYD